MVQHHLTALDYDHCHYGNSQLQFRGPQKDLTKPYCAFLGGSETYGKCVEQPYPDLVGTMLGRNVVNLGMMNAGVDAYLLDETLMNICVGADATVVQVLGAQNLNNNFYSVHPRRNDRFLRASGLLHAIFPGVDFSRFHFTGHLIHALHAESPRQFCKLRDDLQECWVDAMTQLIARVGGRVILLYLADHALTDEQRPQTDPMLVTRKMVEALRPKVHEIVEVVARADEIEAGYRRLQFTDAEELVARQMLGPVVQEAVARKLEPALARIL